MSRPGSSVQIVLSCCRVVVLSRGRVTSGQRQVRTRIGQSWHRQHAVYCNQHCATAAKKVPSDQELPPILVESH